MGTDLLGDLRPVSSATGATIAERFLDGCRAVLALQESEERRCIEDIHAAGFGLPALGLTAVAWCCTSSAR